MSIDIMSRIWKSAKAEGGALLVLLALADAANHDGIAWPKRDTIATKARLTERQVTTILNKLEETGELLVSTGRGRGHRSFYKILIGLTDEERATAQQTFSDEIRGINFSFSQKGKLKREITSPLSTKQPLKGEQTSPLPEIKGEVCDIEKEKFTAQKDRGLIDPDASNPASIRHVEPSCIHGESREGISVTDTSVSDPPSPSIKRTGPRRNNLPDRGTSSELKMSAPAAPAAPPAVPAVQLYLDLSGRRKITPAEVQLITEAVPDRPDSLERWRLAILDKLGQGKMQVAWMLEVYRESTPAPAAPRPARPEPPAPRRSPSETAAAARALERKRNGSTTPV